MIITTYGTTRLGSSSGGYSVVNYILPIDCCSTMHVNYYIQVSEGRVVRKVLKPKILHVSTEIFGIRK